MCVSQESDRLGDLMADLLDCNRLITAGARDAETYLRRAEARWMVRDRPGAIEDLTAAIEADPAPAPDRLAYGFYRRSVCRHQRLELADAIADATASLALRPTSYAFTARAIARYFDGDIAGALADVECALARRPGDWEATAFRGRARLDQGRLRGAIEDFTHVIDGGECHKYASDLHLARAEALLALGDPAGAVADCTTAIDVSGHEQSHWPFIVASRAANAHRPYLLRARARLAMGQVPRALADCYLAATISPADAEVYALRARVFQTAGQLDEAFLDLARAEHLQPTADVASLAAAGAR